MTERTCSRADVETPGPTILRLTGEQIDSVQPPLSDDWFTDFDEYAEFVPLIEYLALNAQVRCKHALNAALVGDADQLRTEMGQHPGGWYPEWCDICDTTTPCVVTRAAAELSRLDEYVDRLDALWSDKYNAPALDVERIERAVYDAKNAHAPDLFMPFDEWVKVRPEVDARIETEFAAALRERLLEQRP